MKQVASQTATLQPAGFILLATCTTTALMAGLFFAWSVSVNPGLARLPDTTYLSVMQSINRAIENPLFGIVFAGAPILLLIATGMNFSQPHSARFRLLLVATLIYLAGSLAVTVFGNLPLNGQLDKLDLSASPDELAAFRARFQGPWNTLHGIRTWASVLSFILTLLACR